MHPMRISVSVALLAASALQCGCVPIPHYRTEAAPSVLPHVPTELQSGELEFLVLAHYRTGASLPDLVDKPLFVKGNALASLQQAFHQFSSRGLGVLLV